ncbi:hypothetical protein P4S72_11350 [Vibrio sp. PP-XX7]
MSDQCRRSGKILPSPGRIERFHSPVWHGRPLGSPGIYSGYTVPAAL